MTTASDGMPRDITAYRNGPKRTGYWCSAGAPPERECARYTRTDKVQGLLRALEDIRRVISKYGTGIIYAGAIDAYAENALREWSKS